MHDVARWCMIMKLIMKLIIIMITTVQTYPSCPVHLRFQSFYLVWCSFNERKPRSATLTSARRAGETSAARHEDGLGHGWCKMGSYHLQLYGCFLKWWYHQNTPKWSFLVGNPMVVWYHHFRKPPYRGHNSIYNYWGSSRNGRRVPKDASLLDHARCRSGFRGIIQSFDTKLLIFQFPLYRLYIYIIIYILYTVHIFGTMKGFGRDKFRMSWVPWINLVNEQICHTQQGGGFNPFEIFSQIGSFPQK